MDFYKNAYDLESIYRTVLAKSGEEQIRGIECKNTVYSAIHVLKFVEKETGHVEPTEQDDEVEILLQAFKKVDCPTCYADIKNVKKLNETLAKEWQKSKSLKMILYWLNGNYCTVY